MNRRAFLTVVGGVVPAAAAGCSAQAGQSGAPGKGAAAAFEVTKTDAEWRTILTPAQFSILRDHDTERPGSSPLNDEHRQGTYRCAGCQLPVYSSAAKFESGTGWPSFTASLPNAVGTSVDRSLFETRTEVHCRRCGGHLGHVFDDGPAPTGKRHCINGAAMTFVPAASRPIVTREPGPAIRIALVVLGLAIGALPIAAQTAAARGQTATATFAGGCFWCMEPPFDALDGVISTTSGYTGGKTPSPTYEQVSEGRTGHTEALQIVYDPSRISYARLLEVFWRNVDAVDGRGQFCDRGTQYRPAIFYHSDEEKRQADASKERIAAQLGKAVAVQIVPGGEFYKAEDYHQDYYKKNPVRYKFYSWNCGRAQRLEQLWGKPPTQ